MRDLERILTLWRELNADTADYVLATVVAIDGPSYRKPGALMLLAGDGRRAGTVSGGCLEAEVSSRAWWLTANGPTIQRYSTADDDGDRPFGSGCGGVIFLLLERCATADVLLSALEHAFAQRIPLAIATVLEGHSIAHRAFAGVNNSLSASDKMSRALEVLAEKALADRAQTDSTLDAESGGVKVWTEFRAPRPGLSIYGAGDDALPLLRLAKDLGWYVTVSDGRSHLATNARFGGADLVHVLTINDMPESSTGSELLRRLRPDDAAIVMTHSFEQDSKILASLLALDTPPAYVGVLGPQRRTRELLVEAAHLLHISAGSISTQVERWLNGLHAPTGLDLGGDSPETIALSILAEIQKTRTAASGLALRTVRAAKIAHLA